MIMLASVSVGLLASCERPSGYEVRFAAVRATLTPEEPVDISLWLYPIDSEEKITNYFDERTIEGTLWVFLPGSEFVSIPEDAISESDDFAFRIKMNPNRFLTPPDAIFEVSVALQHLLSPDRLQPVSLDVRARGGAPYEVRLEFREAD